MNFSLDLPYFLHVQDYIVLKLSDIEKINKPHPKLYVAHIYIPLKYEITKNL